MADQGIEGFLRRQRIKAVQPYLNGRVRGTGEDAASADADHYPGMKWDEVLLSQARRRFANYQFVSGLPEPTEKFNSIISLAVIDYVSIPAQFLRMLAGRLDDIPISKPAAISLHLLVGWIHNAGAALGLFFKHADKENKDLLVRAKLATADNQAGLNLVPHHCFLSGANHRIAVSAKDYL